jgi:hypothetical protein
MPVGREDGFALAATMTPRFKFRLITVLVVVVAIPCSVAFVRYGLRAPMSSGAIFFAICYAKDWDTLTKSLTSSKQGDFTIHTFDAVDPKGLFKGFSQQPNLVYGLSIPDRLGGFRSTSFGIRKSGPSEISIQTFRPRPADCPVGGYEERLDFNDIVTDVSAMSGVLEESVLIPNRYFMSCVVSLRIGDRSFHDGSATPNNSGHRYVFRLRYGGTLQGNVIVFSAPICDDLVQLVIIDVQGVGGEAQSGDSE